MEWKKKTAPHKEVKVEANAAGLAPTCLFASDHMLASPFIEPFKETEFITSRPEYIDKQSIVYRDSPFEIAVVGMYISQKKEGKLTNCHQTSVQMACAKRVLLYSLLRESGDVGEDNDALPFIHYDPSKDDKHVSQHANAAPDQFIPIPASKSLFMASDGMQPAAKARRSVNCRFKVLQLDAIDDMLQMCLAGIEQLTSHIGQFSHAAPLLGLLSPALSLASSVSKCALEAHAKPDKVIMTDMNFLLAERARPRLKEDRSSEMAFEHRSGEYLRYGYYFFLQERVDAKLYASFRTFPNVTLMMKRADADTVCGNEKLFFPLTDVSYLVIRVTGRVSGCRATRKAIRMSHVQRLEDVFNTAVAWCDAGGNGADAVNVVRSLATLADDLGISRDQQGTRGDT